jgi:hypothetical protein
MRQAMVAVSAAVLMAAGTASAVERDAAAAAAPGPVDLKIADDTRSGSGRFSGLDYEKSDRFGRAWVVLHYASRGPCPGSEGECDLDEPVPVSVPGLAYDPAARQVVYERAGAAPVVCASVRRSGFLGLGEALAATGNCTTRLVKVDRLLDDGFDGQRDRREEIHFAIAGR